MSVRMTLGLAVLALGFAIAALAGIPALIENRSLGDVVAVVGLAVALTGGVVMLTAIPGQRRTKAQAERIRQADIDNLRVKHRRINNQLEVVKYRIDAIDKAFRLPMMGSVVTESSQAAAREEAAERRALDAERINLEAELAFNANELRRIGVEPT